MIIDASILFDLLISAPASVLIRQRLALERGPLNSPYLIDAEVMHVLRRHEARRVIDDKLGRAAIQNLASFPLRRYGHAPLLARVWALRHNISAYDALYVGLAELLNEPLLTRDKRLAASAGHRAMIEVI